MSLQERFEDRDFHHEAGRLCLNFTATVGLRGPDQFERLPDGDHLGRWLVVMGLYDRPPVVDEAGLAQARALREAIYGVVNAVRQGTPPDPAHLTVLNRWAGEKPLAHALGPDGRKADWVPDQPLSAALATIACDAVDLLAGEWVARIGECARADCTVLFVDTSRPGRRRWCSMNRCGNHQKKRNLKVKGELAKEEDGSGKQGRG